MTMERKIGEIFEYNGEWYQCIEGRCRDCYFSEERFLCKQFITKNFCTSGIIFKKLKKVGEPFYSKFFGKFYQMYKTYIPAVGRNFKIRVTPVEYVGSNEIFIEIKQNKEDMEENKTTFPKEDNALTRTVYAYINGKISDEELIKSIKGMPNEYPYDKNSLKPFSLEAAKAGKPVCTRDGRKARIICFDGKGDQPIIALVEAKGNKDALIEKVERYFINGHPVFEVSETNDDLMMPPEKKEGWVNVYKGGLLDTKSYPTKKESFDKACPKDYVATVKIQWEE